MRQFTTPPAEQTTKSICLVCVFLIKIQVCGSESPQESDASPIPRSCSVRKLAPKFLINQTCLFRLLKVAERVKMAQPKKSSHYLQENRILHLKTDVPTDNFTYAGTRFYCIKNIIYKLFLTKTNKSAH